MKIVTVIGIDQEGFHIGCPHEVETIKQAKEHIKDCMLEKTYWNDGAEKEDFWKEVNRIEIQVDSETHSEFYLNE